MMSSVTILNFVHIEKTSSWSQPAFGGTIDHNQAQALHNFQIFHRSDVSISWVFEHGKGLKNGQIISLYI